MKRTLLGDVCEVNPAPKALDLESQCSFVPMEYVDEYSGSITQTSVRRVVEVMKGYTYFKEGDVLFAKITPCMENGKCAIAKNLVNGIGFGSTEFHVLRAKDEVIPEWIYYFLRQDHTRQMAARRMTGSAGQQRVPKSFLEDEALMPLPPLPEQQRIAAQLDKADRLRRLRRFALDLGETYLQSVFLEMFGDPVRNEKGWSRQILGELIEINPGLSKKSFLRGDTSVTFVPMAAVDEEIAEITLPEVREYQEVAKGFTTFEEQDVLFAKITPCMENGKSAIAKRLVNGVGFGSTEFHVLRPSKAALPEWLLAVVRSHAFRNLAQRSFTGTAGQQRVPTNFLELFAIPVPPLALQEKFAGVVRQYDRLRAQQRESLRQAEMLFGAMLEGSFQPHP